MQMQTDRKLVDRLIKGDERAFDGFFASYFPRLYRFALGRVGGDGDLAEEAVQNALCKAIDKLKTYRAEAPLFSWLCTFCRHEIYALTRRSGREQVALREDDPGVRAALESLFVAADYDPELAASRSEVGRWVQATLDHLPTLYGNLLEWKYLHGLSVKEIAARIDRGPKATESLLTRSRQAFRDGFNSFTQGGADGTAPLATAGKPE